MSDKTNGNGKPAGAKNGKPAKKRRRPSKAEIAERLKAEQEAPAKRIAAIIDEVVVVGDVGDRRWQREHDMVVGHGQQLDLAFGQPFLRRRALAPSW